MHLEQIDIIYDSYLEDSIQECERIRRRCRYEPLQFMNLKATSPIPVQIDCFWACGKNKEALQLLSRNLFKGMCYGKQLRIILSGYVTNADAMRLCIQVNQEATVTLRPDLDSSLEQADCRIIPHVEKAALTGIQRAIIYSNDTDVVVYLLYIYIHHFIDVCITIMV